jgi:hypothetical protein
MVGGSAPEAPRAGDQQAARAGEQERRSGSMTSWLTGLTLGAGGGFLALEFPIVGLAITVATIVLIWRSGSALAGTGGLLVGLGGMWFALFGRVALTCTEASGCEAPGIAIPVLIGAGLLAIGLVLSITSVARDRRA